MEPSPSSRPCSERQRKPQVSCPLPTNQPLSGRFNPPVPGSFHPAETAWHWRKTVAPIHRVGPPRDRKGSNKINLFLERDAVRCGDSGLGAAGPIPKDKVAGPKEYGAFPGTGWWVAR